MIMILLFSEDHVKTAVMAAKIQFCLHRSKCPIEIESSLLNYNHILQYQFTVFLIK